MLFPKKKLHFNACLEENKTLVDFATPDRMSRGKQEVCGEGKNFSRPLAIREVYFCRGLPPLPHPCFSGPSSTSPISAVIFGRKQPTVSRKKDVSIFAAAIYDTIRRQLS